MDDEIKKEMERQIREELEQELSGGKKEKPAVEKDSGKIEQKSVDIDKKETVPLSEEEIEKQVREQLDAELSGIITKKDESGKKEETEKKDKKDKEDKDGKEEKVKPKKEKNVPADPEETKKKLEEEIRKKLEADLNAVWKTDEGKKKKTKSAKKGTKNNSKNSSASRTKTAIELNLEKEKAKISAAYKKRSRILYPIITLAAILIGFVGYKFKKSYLARQEKLQQPKKIVIIKKSKPSKVPGVTTSSRSSAKHRSVSFIRIQKKVQKKIIKQDYDGAIKLLQDHMASYPADEKNCKNAIKKINDFYINQDPDAWKMSRAQLYAHDRQKSKENKAVQPGDKKPAAHSGVAPWRREVEINIWGDDDDGAASTKEEKKEGWNFNHSDDQKGEGEKDFSTKAGGEKKEAGDDDDDGAEKKTSKQVWYY